MFVLLQNVNSAAARHNLNPHLFCVSLLRGNECLIPFLLRDSAANGKVKPRKILLCFVGLLLPQQFADRTVRTTGCRACVIWLYSFFFQYVLSRREQKVRTELPWSYFSSFTLLLWGGQNASCLCLLVHRSCTFLLLQAVCWHTPLQKLWGSLGRLRSWKLEIET